MNRRSIKNLEKQANTTMPKDIKLTLKMEYHDPDSDEVETEMKEITVHPAPGFKR